MLRAARAKAPAVLKGAALVTGTASAVGLAWAYHLDTKSLEGLKRSAIFWSHALPIWAHYRVTQVVVSKLPEELQSAIYEPLHELYAPKALEIIHRLKGFYVKIGQIASTRSDFLPDAYYRRVATLQDSMPPEPFPYVRRLVEVALGKPLERTFRSFDETPLGAASIGQAHKAVLLDGREVVVKVMFPNVEDMFRSDIKTMKDFTRLAQPEHVPMLDEIEKQFLTEFDYTKEAENLQEVGDNMRRAYSDRVVVPRPIQATHSVLIMEYVPGVKLVDALTRHFEVIAAAKGMTFAELQRDIAAREAQGEHVEGATSAQTRRLRAFLAVKDALSNVGTFVYNWTWVPLARATPAEFRRSKQPLDVAKLLDTLFLVHGHQIFVDGCFNGDPHPGNILLTPDGRLGLIDFGQVKRIDLETRLQLARLIVALADDDEERVVSAYHAMGFRTAHMDPYVAYHHAKCGFDNDHADNLGGTNIQLFLEGLNARDAITHTPDEYIMAGRVAVLLRGLAYALKYSPRTALLWRPLAEDLLRKHPKEAAALAARAAGPESQHAQDVTRLTEDFPQDSKREKTAVAAAANSADTTALAVAPAAA